MHPFSKERLQFVEARIAILGQMVQELTLRQSRYTSNPHLSNLHPQVMNSILAEYLQLMVERNVIDQHLENEAALGKQDALK